VNGSTLGERYRVEARIGAGGMAEVFRGMDPVLNRTVAIKVLLPQFARDAGFVARFRREAQAAARLNHPNIVGVYDTGADGDTQFIVMEFVEGRTLSDFLGKGGRPTPMQAVELAQKIATALSIAHQQGIVHRDIKPANVMVTRDGSVKVMDFGIARIETVETAPQTSAVLGTPTYLSPEQAQGEKVDARSDIYSLGCVLYEMLTGRPPFIGDSPVAIAYKQVNEAPIPPGQLNADVPPRLDAVVMKALSKNPANRYQTAEALAADLERVRKGQDVEATPLLAGAAGGEATQVIARPQQTQVLPPPQEPEGSGRKVWLGVLIGALVVLILAGGGYLLANVLTDNGETEAFTMPDVKGEQFDVAKERLEELGLEVLDAVEEETEEADPGTVVRQRPQPDTEVQAGDAVTLWIAIRPQEIEVPNLTGYTLEDAAFELEELGLQLGEKIPITSDTIEPGRIADQDPPPGTLLDPSEDVLLVDVFVVEGPSTVTVGDYTCLTPGKATSELRKIGLDSQVVGTAPPLPECPNPNFVALQDPAPGSVVDAGTIVDLYTGSEPSPTATATPT
jgi:serine/threonine-protein kinase